MSAQKTVFGLLAADGPDPRYAQELALFGRLVGSWDLDMEVYDRDGSVDKRSGEWHFGWILGGRAIQDVLIVRNWKEPGDKDNPRDGVGTGLRVYDPSTDSWWVVWIGPAKGECNTLVARAVEGQIVMERQSSLGEEAPHFQWTFIEVTEDIFRCQGRESSDGKTWRMVETLLARRRNPSVS